jgi:hypothetical protein
MSSYNSEQPESLLFIRVFASFAKNEKNEEGDIDYGP